MLPALCQYTPIRPNSALNSVRHFLKKAKCNVTARVLAKPTHVEVVYWKLKPCHENILNMHKEGGVMFSPPDCI